MLESHLQFPCPEVLIDYAPSFLTTSNLAGKQDETRPCASAAGASGSGPRPRVSERVFGNRCHPTSERGPGVVTAIQVHVRGCWLREYFPVSGWVPGDSADEKYFSMVEVSLDFWQMLSERTKKKRSKCFIQEVPCKIQFTVSLACSSGYSGRLRETLWKYNYFWCQRKYRN